MLVYCEAPGSKEERRSCQLLGHERRRSVIGVRSQRKELRNAEPEDADERNAHGAIKTERLDESRMKLSGSNRRRQ